jgi:hypothetical protein
METDDCYKLLESLVDTRERLLQLSEFVKGAEARLLIAMHVVVHTEKK